LTLKRNYRIFYKARRKSSASRCFVPIITSNKGKAVVQQPAGRSFFQLIFQFQHDNKNKTAISKSVSLELLIRSVFI
jgi:hypothetical protein